MQDITDHIGLPRPTSVIGSSDPQTRLLLRHLNIEGQHLARRHDWQALQKEKTWTAAATQAQTGVLPTDFDRFLGGTFYNRTRNRLVTGPLTPQEWQDYQASLTTLVYDAFRLKGGVLYLLPTPTGTHSYAFEYMSKYWCGPDSGSTPTLTAFAADADLVYLPELLLTMGTVWRFRQARGFDYAEDFRSYETELHRIIGRDGGKRTLNMGAAHDKRVPRAPQAPDGSWSL
jgi:hypothetical protein